MDIPEPSGGNPYVIACNTFHLRELLSDLELRWDDDRKVWYTHDPDKWEKAVDHVGATKTGDRKAEISDSVDPETVPVPEQTVSTSERADAWFRISTDGACLNNPGPGGWAAVIKNDGEKAEITGREPDTTNNRMEGELARRRNARAFRGPQSPAYKAKKPVHRLNQRTGRGEASPRRDAEGLQRPGPSRARLPLHEGPSVHGVLLMGGKLREVLDPEIVLYDQGFSPNFPRTTARFSSGPSMPGQSIRVLSISMGVEWTPANAIAITDHWPST
jgi:hypothetical protein